MCSKENCRFQQLLAYHTAPSLLGIKCASLVSLCREDFDIASHTNDFNHRAAAKGLKIQELCGCGRRALLLVYSPQKLGARLMREDCREVLRGFGYTDDMSCEVCLRRLAERIEGADEFPHEIGIFLDYPVEDVVGFMQNNGSNFKLCGYWKVYGNPEAAQRTFENYNKCRKFLCGKLDEGVDLCRALKL